MRAACKLGAEVRDYAGTLVKVILTCMDLRHLAAVSCLKLSVGCILVAALQNFETCKNLVSQILL